MTTGYSGTYAVNGTDFLLIPTKAKWEQRDNLGFDGNGHPIYPTSRTFVMQWDLMHPSDAEQIISAYNSAGSTGTLSFDLPEYGNPNYLFSRYNGCTMEEPEFGDYFQGYISDGKLKIHLVKTK